MKRVVFVGQAMPAVKRHPHDWPSLNLWLYSIGLTDKDIQENFLYTALVDYFPGYKGRSHKVPTNIEIEKERDRLKKTIIDFNPDILVSIGRLSIANCLGVKNVVLNDHIGKSYNLKPYGLTPKEITVIPLPHPSGASTWRHKPENKILLRKALAILKKSYNNLKWIIKLKQIIKHGILSQICFLKQALFLLGDHLVLVET